MTYKRARRATTHRKPKIDGYWYELVNHDLAEVLMRLHAEKSVFGASTLYPRPTGRILDYSRQRQFLRVKSHQGFGKTKIHKITTIIEIRSSWLFSTSSNLPSANSSTKTLYHHHQLLRTTNFIETNYVSLIKHEIKIYRRLTLTASLDNVMGSLAGYRLAAISAQWLANTTISARAYWARPVFGIRHISST